jgi:multidrug efflux pump
MAGDQAIVVQGIGQGLETLPVGTAAFEDIDLTLQQKKNEQQVDLILHQTVNGFGYEWSGQSYQEILSGQQAPILFALSLLVVFLALAALYESWSIPVAVMLVVPLGVLGALSFTWLRGLEDDVYFKVGLIAVIGLSAKNAILIIEFANTMRRTR